MEARSHTAQMVTSRFGSTSAAEREAQEERIEQRQELFEQRQNAREERMEERERQ